MNALNLPPLTLPDTEIAKQPKTRLKSLLSFIVIMAASLAVGYGLGSLFDTDIDLTGTELALLAVGGIFGLFLVILLHELGHLLGGKLAGFRFVLLIVGPLKVTSSASGPQFGWNRAWALAGGLAASFPTTDDNLRNGFFSMIAGGPLTSLLCGLLFLLPSLILQPADSEITVWYLLLQILGVTSLLIGLATLVPSETGGFKSDGRRLLELWRNDPAALATNLIALLSASSLLGIRPRDWDARQIEPLLPLTDQKDNLAVTVATFLYGRALDMGELAEARDQLQRILELNHLRPPVVQTGALLDAAFFEAWYRKDLVQAERFLPKPGKDGLAEPQARLLAETAVALLKQQFDQAQTLLDQSEAALEKTMDPGTAHLTRDIIAAMRQVIQT